MILMSTLASLFFLAGIALLKAFGVRIYFRLGAWSGLVVTKNCFLAVHLFVV